MTKKLYIRSKEKKQGINIPWRMSGINDSDQQVTWQRRTDEQRGDGSEIVGPTGQYWKTNADDTFDKTVWVVEDEAPIVLRNPVDDQPSSRVAASSEILNVEMATGHGQRILGWDPYEDIILGETTGKFYISHDIGKFEWAAWRANAGTKISQADADALSEDSAKRLGDGVAQASPKNGSTILGYRLVGGNLSNDVAVNKWKEVSSLGKLDTDKVPGLTALSQYKDTISRHNGKEYFTINKSVLADAIGTGGQKLQLTWMSPPSVSVKSMDPYENLDINFTINNMGNVQTINNLISDKRLRNEVVAGIYGSASNKLMFIDLKRCLELLGDTWKILNKTNLTNISGGRIWLGVCNISYTYKGQAKKTNAASNVSGSQTFASASVEGIRAKDAGMLYTNNNTTRIKAPQKSSILLSNAGPVTLGCFPPGGGGYTNTSTGRPNISRQVRLPDYAAQQNKTWYWTSNLGTFKIPINLLTEGKVGTLTPNALNSIKITGIDFGAIATVNKVKLTNIGRGPTLQRY